MATKFKKAIWKGINGLESRSNLTVVPKHSVPDVTNLFGGEFVLTIYNEKTQNEIRKVRFVTEKQENTKKSTVVHRTLVARQFSTKVVISVSAIKGLRLLLTDVTRTFLERKETLERESFVKTCQKFGLSPDIYLK